MCSSAKQPNKHIIALSRRPPAMKSGLPYKREHVCTAAQDVDISPAGGPSFWWHRPSFRVTWPWEGSRGPRMAAGGARQAHTAPTNHQKRYQIPRRKPRRVHSCHIRHCSKMHSSAQQPNNPDAPPAPTFGTSAKRDFQRQKVFTAPKGETAKRQKEHMHFHMLFYCICVLIL